MSLDLKQKIAIGSVALLAAFAAGRWAAPEKIKIETKTVEVERKVEDTKVNKDTHKETVVTEVVKPDGTKEVTTKTTEDTKAKTDTSQTIVDNKTTDTLKEVTRGTAKVSVQALVGINALSLSSPPVYGIAIAKPILGPITVGAWGLSSGVVGGSIGLTF